MTTFIERHGYVRYPVTGYSPSGPCEIPGCENARLRERVYHFIWRLTEYQRSFLGYSKYGITYQTPLYVVDHCHKHGWIRGVICGTCNNLMASYDNFGSVHLRMWEPWEDYGSYEFRDRMEIYHETRIIRSIMLGEYALNCPECAAFHSPQQGMFHHVSAQPTH
jgi:hypothetical protein